MNRLRSARVVIEPRYLLDTDTFVYIRRGRPEKAQARFQRLRPGEAVLSVITYGELVYGIAKKRVGPEPMLRLEELTQIVQVMPLMPETAASTVRSARPCPPKGKLSEAMIYGSRRTRSVRT